ncbi:unnamed protein product [Paramecium octaurelia]|uniref:Uncharacterized protein n=1 Tax=Paramecium octaurelia TaxID=43137 RepID=A0A8S1Y8A0_PAROT|nr:unnamed protein product [Paramecium octaurelia]
MAISQATLVQLSGINVLQKIQFFYFKYNLTIQNIEISKE